MLNLFRVCWTICWLGAASHFAATAVQAAPLEATSALTATRSEPVIQRGFRDFWYFDFKQFSRDNRRFVAKVNRSAIGVWDTRSGELRQQWKLASGTIQGAQLLPDNRTLALIEAEPSTPLEAPNAQSEASAANARLYTYHLRWRERDSGATVKSLLSLSDNAIHHLTLSPDGRFLAAVIGDQEGYVARRFGQSEREKRDELAMWSAQSGQLLWRQRRETLPSNQKPELISKVLFAPDSNSVAAIVAKHDQSGNYRGSGNSIELHDTRDGKLLHELKAPIPTALRGAENSETGQEFYFSDLRFLSATNQLVAFGKGDYSGHYSPNVVATWSLDSGQLARFYAPIARAHFSDNSAQLYATSDPAQFVFYDTRGHRVEQWNAASGEVQSRTLQGMEATPRAEAETTFDAATWTLQVRWATYDAARSKFNFFSGAWDVRSGRRTAVIAPVEPQKTPMASDDGRWQAKPNEQGGVSFLDRQSGQTARVDVMQPFRYPLRAVAFASLASGRTRLALATDGEVAVWDVATKRMRFFSAFAGQQITDLSFSPDGRFLACGGGRDLVRQHHGAVKVWDLGSGRSRVFALRPRIVTGVAWLENGRTLAVSSGLVAGRITAGDVTLWNARSGHFRRTLLQSGNSVTAVTASPDGTKVLCVGFDLHQVRDVRSGKIVAEMPEPTQGFSGNWRKAVAITRDGNTAAHNLDSTVFVWNARKGALLRTLIHRQFDSYPTVGSSSLLEVAISENASHIAATDRAGRLARADGDSTIFTVQPTLSLGEIRPIAFAPRSRLLITGDDDGVARLYDADSGDLRLSLMFSRETVAEGTKAKQNSPTQWIAWTPQGRFDASAAATRFVRWRDGTELKSHSAGFAARRDAAAIAQVFQRADASP